MKLFIQVILISGLALLALLGYKAYMIEDYWLMAFISGGVIASVFFMLKQEKQVEPIPKHKLKADYIQYLEENYSLSIDKDANIYWDDIIDNRLRMVLMDEDDSQKRYFPFEVDRFTGEFLKGAGSIKYRISDVEHWITEEKQRVPMNMELFKNFSSEIDNKINEYMEKNKNEQRNRESDEKTG